MNQRYFLYLSYSGAAYCGWQSQPGVMTVQRRVEEALSLLLRRPVGVVGAGRTDTGVHARLMVAHFDFDGEQFAPSTLVNRLNGVLPPDIAVHKIVAVRPDAHARFDAVSRTYQYFICFEKDAFNYPFHLRMRYELDFPKMNEAAAILLEYNDFACFCKLHSDNRTTVCHITKAEWTQFENEAVFTVRADRFLRNMVRAIVGTLLDVGRGRITAEGFRKIIESGRRSSAGASVPAGGLFLTGIEYPDTLFPLDS
jgi:tRNA pseudouridine38-40 synthase